MMTDCCSLHHVITKPYFFDIFKAKMCGANCCQIQLSTRAQKLLTLIRHRPPSATSVNFTRNVPMRRHRWPILFLLHLLLLRLAPALMSAGSPNTSATITRTQYAILRNLTCRHAPRPSSAGCALHNEPTTTPPTPHIPTTRIPSTPVTRVQLAESLTDRHHHANLVQQVTKLASLQFQQAINCCGLTSVAYALSAVGCPTTADELFLLTGVDIQSAVGDGMTLAELYDASLRYINKTNIPVFVEAYHFDEYTVTEAAFRDACIADADAGIDDILVLNFHTGIAHGWESGGAGHFSVMTTLSADADHVVMADVHGVKYGTFWSTPISQMFSAMQDKDSCGRSRGVLRFGRTDKMLQKPLPGLTPTLLDWTSPPNPFASESLQRYIPKTWDAGIGVRNMEGASALSSAIRVLEGDVPIARLDELMRALNESYTRQLNNFLTAEEVASMGKRLHDNDLTKAVTRVESLASCDRESLLTTLQNAGCGKDGVVILAAYDFNQAVGVQVLDREKGEAGALSHGAKTWSLIADFDKTNVGNSGGVVIAPAHNVILAGRLWTTSLNRLAAAMMAVQGKHCRVVVLDSR